MDGKCQSVATILAHKTGLPGLCMYLNATQLEIKVSVGVRWKLGGRVESESLLCNLKIVKLCGCNQIILENRMYE